MHSWHAHPRLRNRRATCARRDDRGATKGLPLALHILQKHTGAKVLYKNNAPETDHIFPRSILRKKGFDHSQIEDAANFWILAKGKNANKSNKHPAKYFADVPDAEMKRALIEREMLDYRRYPSFLKERKEAMLKAITKEIGLSEADFPADGA